jgi:steroid 5-alpha reductase family enzyme
LAIAGSQNGVKYTNVSLFAIAVSVAFAIQILAFIPAYLFQTEKFYDITGSITYISVAILLIVLNPNADIRSFLLMSLIVIWAIRLGSFLFLRIHKAGKDGRFDDIKPSFPRFLNTWLLQGLWVSFTSAAAWAAITSTKHTGLGIFTLIGLVVWIIGFALEIVADSQKNRFREDSANKGKFIQSGLWSRSRHPNYFGEITLWVGVAIIAIPVLQGWQWVTLISPVFVTLLLTKISGVPLLEKRADDKWGGQKDYEEYKQNTPVLIPRLTAKK